MKYQINGLRYKNWFFKRIKRVRKYNPVEMDAMTVLVPNKKYFSLLKKEVVLLLFFVKFSHLIDKNVWLQKSFDSKQILQSCCYSKFTEFSKIFWKLYQARQLLAENFRCNWKNEPSFFVTEFQSKSQD